MFILRKGFDQIKPSSFFQRAKKLCVPTITTLLFSSAIAVATPSMQHAVVQAGTGDIDVLHYREVPVLEPGQGQVLVRIYAATVNPIDWKNRSGMFVNRPERGYAPPTVTAPTPENTRIPGSDAAGIIEKVGPGVTGFNVGDAVYASISGNGVDGLNGSYSEFAIASADSIFHKPANMTYAQAAGLGTATSTGVGAVVAMDVKAGQRVLILGAAGGVGSAALQAAKERGAYVVGTASSRHQDYLNSLGIDEYYDYRKGTWQDEIKDIDVVIDTVSLDNLKLAMKTVKPGAVVVGFNGSLIEEECQQFQVVCASRGVSGGGVRQEVARLAQAGKLQVNVDGVFPLEKAGEAQEENRNGGTQGKIILAVDPQMVNAR